MVKSIVFVIALARGGCDQAPVTPAGGSGSGGAVASATGSAATKLGQTTLSPEARSQLDKLTGAPPNAPVKQAAPDKPGTKPAKPATKPASSAPPTLAPKPEKPKNLFPERGPQRGEELMEYPEFEAFDKDMWDYGAVRKRGSVTPYGQIYTAYRCDDRNGCDEHSSHWRAIGWHML